MDSAKLKLKIGMHEFEAEGPSEVVQAQFEAFRELVKANVKLLEQPAQSREPVQTPATSNNQSNGSLDLALDKIMRHDDRVVSLTVRGDSLEEEILLLLLGQKRFRDNENVSGSEILEGLRLTRGPVGRVDYQLTRMAERDGTVLSFGTRRARRYRLTNQGAARAKELATALVQRVT